MVYNIYTNIGGILMVNVTIYSIHGSYGYSMHPNGSNGNWCRENWSEVPHDKATGPALCSSRVDGLNFVHFSSLRPYLRRLRLSCKLIAINVEIPPLVLFPGKPWVLDIFG